MAKNVPFLRLGDGGSGPAMTFGAGETCYNLFISAFVSFLTSPRSFPEPSVSSLGKNEPILHHT